jgi:ATP-binding cassette subfamily C protein CydD
MKPLDPRLLREARAARRYLATTTGLGVLTAGLVLVQATLLAHVIAHASDGVAALRGSLVALGAVLLARAAAAYGGEVAALRAAAQVTSQLRRRVVRQALALGPQWLGRRSTGELTTLVTRGLDALEPYFARYLPQLVLGCVVPLAVLVRIAGADLLSAVVIAVTLPLIPVFMALVGMHTRGRTERQWALLAALGGHFLDVVQGLPTLKLFGRAKAQAAIVQQVTEQHRRATMATLRIAFLSALVLELLATLSVALVAVEVGLRLLAGALPYETALMVLLLAPEAYLPLRAVGAQFHASMEGAVAATAALDILAEPLPHRPLQRAVPAYGAVRFEAVSFRHPGREVAQLAGADLTLMPGTTTAVVGPSGAGKSTLVNLLLGLLVPDSGRITVGGVDLAEADLPGWRRQVAWVPQSPQLFTGTLADNVRLGLPDASDDAVAHVLQLAGAAFVEALPAGLQTAVGERGLTLSSGQRQRVALARAFLRDAPVLLLDEPGAHLDLDSDEDLRAVVARLARGRTVLLVTHSAAWTATADVVLRLSQGRLRPRSAEAAA